MTTDEDIDLHISFSNPLFGDWRGTSQAKGATFVDVPVGEICLSCGTPILDEEAGEMILLVNARATSVLNSALAQGIEVAHLSDPDVPRAPVHRGCMLLDLFGHRYGVCGCNDFDGLGSRRAGAMELERRLYAAAAISALGDIGHAPRSRGDA